MSELVFEVTQEADGGYVAEALRSSLWVLRDAHWQILFHQGTPTA